MRIFINCKINGKTNDELFDDLRNAKEILKNIDPSIRIMFPSITPCFTSTTDQLPEKDIRDFFSKGDAIYNLPDWKNSKESQDAFIAASEKGLKIYMHENDDYKVIESEFALKNNSIYESIT